MAGNNLGDVTVQNNDRELICGDLGQLDFQLVRRAADGRILTNCSAGHICPAVAVSDRVDKLKICFVVLQQRFKISTVEVPLRIFGIVNNGDVLQTSVATRNRDTPRKRTVVVVHVEEPAVFAEIYANTDAGLDVHINRLRLSQVERLSLTNFILRQGQLRGGNNPAIPRSSTFSRLIEDDLDSAIRSPSSAANHGARCGLHIEIKRHNRLSRLCRKLVLEVLTCGHLRAGRPVDFETNSRPDSKARLGGAALIGQFRLADCHFRRNICGGCGTGCGVGGGSGSVREDLNGTDTTNRKRQRCERRNRALSAEGCHRKDSKNPKIDRFKNILQVIRSKFLVFSQLNLFRFHS